MTTERKTLRVIIRLEHMGDRTVQFKTESPSQPNGSPPVSSQSPEHPQSSPQPKNGHEITFSTSPYIGSPDRLVTSIPPSGARTPTASGARTPGGTIKSRHLTPKFLTPLASFSRTALHLTKLDPTDAWLPITESRNGNAYYAAFHTLCAGIGIQALVLPLAFTILGW